MKILDFIEKAIEVEDVIAECYRALSTQCEPPYAAQLMKLSDDEINHRNILNIGRSFIVRAPDLFGGVTMPEKGLDAGRQELGPLLEAILSRKADWRENLAKLEDLEIKLERVHLTSSVIVRDPSLRALFKGLSAGDQTHGCVLRGILGKSSGLREAPQNGRPAGAS